MYNWKNGDILNAENLNNAQKELIKSIYPIGTIYETTGDTHPNELFGGTWAELEVRDLVELGQKEGWNYWIYTNGDIEFTKAFYVTESLAPQGSRYISVSYPFEVNDIYTFTQVSKKNGGSYWASVDCFFDNSDNVHGILTLYNNGNGNAENLAFNLKVTSKINLDNLTIPTLPKTYVKVLEEA